MGFQWHFQRAGARRVCAGSRRFTSIRVDRPCVGGVGATVVSESALISAGIPLSRVRAPPPAPWPDGWPESLRSPYCGLAIHTQSLC
ncbi:hypothetical protein PoB_002915100 [Plakobranchus ocellatus]|uniref:Uncharacterized protein n=1 Tax=Plakobranchus ocellatus TaxID=259542 RepID=A0AAV4A371_9GAST|nr:hypothetical protein PoB_002915100 [Plakobranchus ocellatus]